MYRRILSLFVAVSLIVGPLIERGALAQTPPANAVSFLQGSLTQLGSALFADATTLHFPITAQRFFFSTAYQLRQSMTLAYPGTFPIVGTSDALGHPSFVVKMLPPTAAISGPGSLSPSLQVLLAGNSGTMLPFTSYVVPNFTVADGAWHTMQVSVGILPTSPGRWFISADDFNMSTFQFSHNAGIFTDVTGTQPLWDQSPPMSFNIPVMSSGLSNGDKYVFWIGQPVKSRNASYAPVSPDNYLDTTPMNITQTYLNLTPAGNVDLSGTLFQFVSLKNIMQSAVAQIMGSRVQATTAQQTALQLARSNQAATLNALSQQMTQLTASITASLTAAARAGASAAVQNSIMAAQNSTAAARQQLAMGQPSAAAGSLGDASTYLDNSINNSTSNVNIGNTTSTVINNSSSVNVSSGSPPPQVYLSGNGSTNTTISSGSVVTVSSGNSSYYQNQVDGGVSMSTTGGYVPAQQAPDDPYMTITDITITPETP